ncbi:IS607 family element RNA-guided endonuclease TnpB [Dactylosporangium sp. NBC_01737]|uniref:IS607 family element RNA-guided endonuclease TnpB n=1 Tax=Dactylosporangium sp. NBC_01737 TaxID=2975959 RepID=UPI002E11A561|nr:IS607 family element RNA-guided endonuclease TnpB [Dactylosporangium sp. NBC_01737]
MKRYEPPAGWTVQAYRFALDPSEIQVTGLRRNTGAARFAYNHMLRRVSAVKVQRDAEVSYGVAEADLTPWQGWSLPDLRRTWNAIKRWVAPWWAECSKEAFNTGLANLSATLGNWHTSRTGARKGRRMGWPRTKRKHGRRSARFSTGAIRVDPGYRHVVLPRLGRIRTHESTRKLARRVRAGTATILSATVTETAGRWFCSFQVAVQRTVRRPAHAPNAGRVVGVDVGIKHLAVLSTGEMVPNPAPFKAALKKLGKAQRRAARRIGPYDPQTGRKRTASKRWRRAQDAVARLHATVAAVRADAWHQLTTRLAQQFTTVVVEDLHVAGMLRNRKLARSLADAASATLRRHLGYKTGWYASTLYLADRWYPSSKTCSACKTVKPKLSLDERTFHCTACGLSLDRDVNAARNLAALVRHVDLELLGDAKTGRGAYVRPVRPAYAGGAAGREASRPVHPVNVARQRTTANHEPRLLTER